MFTSVQLSELMPRRDEGLIVMLPSQFQSQLPLGPGCDWGVDVAVVFCVHTRLPPEQSYVPGPQTPAFPVLQLPPPPGLPSSTAPLQSLSRPSQISGLGPTEPEQAPYAELVLLAAAVQVCVPAWQTPVPSCWWPWHAAVPPIGSRAP